MIHAVRQARRYGEQLAHFDEHICRSPEINPDFDFENVAKVIEASQVYRDQFRGTDIEGQIESAFLAGIISS